MIYILIIIGTICYLLLGSSEDKYTNYDKGYEDAWEGVELSKSVSKETRMGYEDGLDDASAYDDGYDDAYDKKAPRFYKDAVYMDGYKDGKDDRKRGL